MSLRITGGTARGRAIASPLGRDVRPTSSKIRQALFNILKGRLEDSVFLDLFAGTGLMGIEALSRGVSELISVETERQLAKNIKESLEKLSFDGEVITGDVREVIKTLPAYYFDIIFADPPYKSPLAQSVLQLVNRHNLLKEGGLLIIEHFRDTKLPVDEVALQQCDRRDYGQTSISFFTTAGTLESKS